MERFCRSCSSIVTGTGDFCPACGNRLGSVSLEKPQNTSVPVKNSDPHAAQYVNTGIQNLNTGAVPQSMTLGQWVGTILLATCLGPVSIVFLIVWATSDLTPEPKRTYSRAMLVITAVGIVLSVLLIILMITGMICAEPFIEAYFG